MMVGNRVVCINETFSPEIQASNYQLPRLDEVYTVRAVYLGRTSWRTVDGEESAEVGVLLEELNNPFDPRVMVPIEMGFNSERFRVVEEIQIKVVNHGQEEV